MTQDQKLTEDDIDEWMDKINDIIQKNSKWISPLDMSVTEIIDDFLWLGDWSDSQYKRFSKQNIKYILNCCGNSHQYKADYNVKEYVINALDSLNYNIVDNHKDEIIKFINECKEKQSKILVHCFAGVNRSTTMVIVYLLHYYNDYNLLKAIEVVSSKRPGVLGNKSFRRQLILYAYSINKLDGYEPDYVKAKNYKNQAKINIVAWDDDDDDDDDDDGGYLYTYTFCKDIISSLVSIVSADDALQ